MPAVEKRPEDLHAPEVKPESGTVSGPDKWVRKPLASIPWEAMAPVPLEHVPTPLGQVPKADKLPPEAFAEPLGHYADIGLLPPAIYERGPKDKRIDAYQMTLDGANYASQFLKGPEKAKYLEERLDALSKFSQDVAPEDATGNAAATVPTPLIDNARPLIETLEKVQPEYRTQSDNLIPPEASCNMTSLAMALERMGYGREDAMGAIDGELRKRFLDEEKAKLAKQKGDPSTLPKSADEVQLPPGYFEGQVKGYLKAVDGAATKPYQPGTTSPESIVKMRSLRTRSICCATSPKRADGRIWIR